jgi:hypothetical protein
VIFFLQKFKKRKVFLKIQISKIFLIENLWKLVFRHIKLKLLTKASIPCLSHPSMSITTWFMKCFRNCVFAKNYAISGKLQPIQLWKFAVFHTSRCTSSLPSMNKIRVGMVFSLVHLAWNDPHVQIPVQRLTALTNIFRDYSACPGKCPMPQIKAWLVPSTSCPVHCSLIILHSMQYSLR